MNAPAQTSPPAPVRALRTLDLGRMPACMPLDALRLAQLAHEGARLGYDLVRVEFGGRSVYVEAELRRVPKKETLQLIEIMGLRAAPSEPVRVDLLGQMDAVNRLSS